MENWQIAVAVIAAVVVLFGVGWIVKFKVRVGDQELSAQGPPPSTMTSTRSRFRSSRVKGRRGSRVEFTDTDSDGTEFDIK